MPARRSTRRTIAIDDLLAFRIPSDPQISPDGAAALFCLRQASPSRPGEYERSLWTVPAAGGAPRQFTAGPRDGLGRWSPDGSRVAFVRAEPKHRPQLWTIDAAGGEARQLTHFPEGHIASFKWAPDGSRFAVAFRATTPEFSDAAGKARRERGESEPPRVLDDISYRLDGDGYYGAARHALHIVDAGTGRSRLVYDADTLGDFAFDWAPDGERLALTTNTSARAAFEPWLDEIAILHVDNRRAQRLAGVPVGPKSAVSWSPDGRFLAWAGREDDRDGIYSPENLHLWTAAAPSAMASSRATRRAPTPLAGVRCLTASLDVCLMAATLSDCADAAFAPSLAWSPDSRRIYMRLGRRGVGHIASMPRGGGAVTYHTRGGDRTLGSFSADGSRVATIATSPTSPPEVVVASVSSRGLRDTARTALNTDLTRRLIVAPYESHEVVADDGQRSQVWVLRPPGASPRTRTAAILMVHGGPHAMYGEAFFHEMQFFAGSGYTVLIGNPRGSKGYGEAFCEAIRGDWGNRDWADVQASLRFLQSHPGVDPKRIAIAGGSYGGYMTNWAIGHTRAFRCAITDRCVCNLLSMAGNSDYPDFGEYWPGKVWKDWEVRWDRSPIKHFGAVRTPTLVIHSEGDLRCNVEQGEQVFTALSELGVPVRFIRYPAGTSHGMSRTGPPDLRRHRLRAMAEWLDRWLRPQGRR